MHVTMLLMVHYAGFKAKYYKSSVFFRLLVFSFIFFRVGLRLLKGLLYNQ